MWCNAKVPYRSFVFQCVRVVRRLRSNVFFFCRLTFKKWRRHQVLDAWVCVFVCGVWVLKGITHEAHTHKYIWMNLSNACVCAVWRFTNSNWKICDFSHFSFVWARNVWTNACVKSSDCLVCNSFSFYEFAIAHYYLSIRFFLLQSCHTTAPSTYHRKHRKCAMCVLELKCKWISFLRIEDKKKKMIFDMNVSHVCLLYFRLIKMKIIANDNLTDKCHRCGEDISVMSSPSSYQKSSIQKMSIYVPLKCGMYLLTKFRHFYYWRFAVIVEKTKSRRCCRIWIYLEPRRIILSRNNRLRHEGNGDSTRQKSNDNNVH